MSFPTHRPRRLRTSPQLRALAAETSLAPGCMVYPLFVLAEGPERREITSMPGCFQLSLDGLEDEVRQVADLGIPAVLLFGLPATKDLEASGAYQEDGIVQQAIRRTKQVAPNLLVIADTCLCEYTSHGHCGVVDPRTGYLLNDPTLELLAKTAVSQARAGADIIAPSDMMDGRVAAIRQALDAEGLATTPILSYAAKYASAFYGPFRDAADSAPQFGDRRQYQMDPANRREALKEMRLDLEEGADMLMVKPALPYLDVLREAWNAFDVPLAAYNVSGEYSMVKAAAAQGWIDEQRVVLELLTGIRRAGADIVITYHAKDAARWLGSGASSPEPLDMPIRGELPCFGEE